MKKILPLICLILIVSCKTAPVLKTENTGSLQVHIEDRLIPLYEGKADGPVEWDLPNMHIRLNLIDVPDGVNPNLQRLFRALFYDGMDPQDYADKFIADMEKEFRQGKEEFERNPDWGISVFSRVYEEAFEADLYTAQLVVIRRDWYEYTGGAHGNFLIDYFVIDPAVAKRLTLDDILKTEARPLVLARIEEALRNMRELKDGEPLTKGGFFEETVNIPDNFFLSPEGLGFLWNIYEIAPYAYGPIEVILPYEKVMGCLTPKGRVFSDLVFSR
ncbi:hypothetical protein FACS1894110_13120 [Spirochaetia bacterium]|nr:hypothetical protein FACS1894110_13120 [Spirochaetia bacterium]